MASETAAALISDLQDQLNAFAWKPAGKSTRKIAGRVSRDPGFLDNDSAKRILQMLRRKRRFGEMQVVADALLSSGERPQEVRRQLAQSLIDLGQTAAPKILLEEIADRPASPKDWREAVGLMGRIEKQIYVNAKDPRSAIQQEHLARAIRYYDRVYQRGGDVLWHGINVVALTRRARLDSVPLSNLSDENELARRIAAEIGAKQKPNAWDHATALEAHVALGEWRLALEAAKRFAESDDADAFEVASCVRQLKEVWRLDSRGAGDEVALLSLLQGALLRKEGGEVRLESSEARIALDLESSFGETYEPIQWLHNALACAASVARVKRAGSGTAVGTGFVLEASRFLSDLGDKPVFLTNFHVISPGGSYPNSVAPEEAKAHFEIANEEFAFGKVLKASPPGQLDFAFLTLEGFTHAKRRPIPYSLTALESFAKATPAEGAKRRIYAIGHPKGGNLSVSLHNSHLVDYDGKWIHYRTPTEPGSSGSPIFQEDWEAVGLHHAGKTEERDANEGISLRAIRDEVIKPA